MDKCHFYARFISESGLCTQTACFPIPQLCTYFFTQKLVTVSQGLIMRHAGIRSPEGENTERRVARWYVSMNYLDPGLPSMSIIQGQPFHTLTLEFTSSKSDNPRPYSLL